MASNPIQPSPAELRAHPVQAIANQATALGGSFAGAADNASAAARATLALVERPELRDAASRDPSLSQRLAALAQQANTRLADIEARKKQLQQAFTQLNTDLERFRRH
jgi:hypothetical protein